VEAVAEGAADRRVRPGVVAVVRPGVVVVVRPEVVAVVRPGVVAVVRRGVVEVVAHHPHLPPVVVIRVVEVEVLERACHRM
jgi:hypothetical protein